MNIAVWDLKSQLEKYKGEDVFDCLIAEFLLSDGRFVHGEEDVLKKYKVKTLSELAEKQKEKLAERPNLLKLFTEIEMPLVSVLYKMEKAGILLDTEKLKTVGEEIEKAIVTTVETIKKEIDPSTGSGQSFEINLNSSIQVGNYLAEKMGVPLAKTKTGRYATSESELTQYAETFPLIKELLKYRELSKLRSTYVESLIEKVDADGRVHTTYNQVAASTGRLASANPNLQNIPVTSDFGQKIKSCFTAEEGKVLISFDYSQQELRILAHLTGEEKLIEAFNNDLDVHKTTASQLFKVSYDEVTKEQRSIAKTINFGIIYGMGSYGMSMGLNIPVDEAKNFIDAFYATYPKIKKYYDHYIKQGQIDGFVETLLGRRRYVFEDGPPSFAKASEGQRKFIDNNMRRVLLNYPIQGTAADLIKKAMVEIDREILTKDPTVQLLLQIHDDLVFEVKNDPQKIESLIEKVKGIMCHVYPLSVPITVDVKMGKSWGEMGKVQYATN